ncbi:MAG: serine/threonine-protein kinase [Cyanobacteria bacterium P01_F01_bin.143]
METIYNSGNIIQERYSIINQLGEGGSGITYAAQDLTKGTTVAIKVLSLNQLEDWKKIELFEREAKILRQLEHPSIPEYLDYFQLETEENSSFYIIQQLAPGKSIASLINAGWQPEESEIKAIAEQVLEILVYLQQLTPPVIHRDLKPQNIIYQPDTGNLFLVDFGAVQDTYHHTVMGSTVVGTYGYMAPEQFRGGAVLATDLYSLGCTLLFLLTLKSPAELPQENLKLNFRKQAKLNRNFAKWLDKLVAPDICDRFPKAEDALKVLHDKNLISNYKNNSVKKPRNSKIKLTYYQKKLIMNLPPARLSKHKSISYYLLFAWILFFLLNAGILIICVHPVGILALILLARATLVSSSVISNIIYLTQAIAFTLLLWLYTIYFPLNISFYISWLVVITQFCCNFKLQYKLLREMQYPTKVECSSSKIVIKRKVNGFWHLDTVMDSERLMEIDEYIFGKYLTRAEKRWLAVEMNKYLEDNLKFASISTTEKLFSGLGIMAVIVVSLTSVFIKMYLF